MAEESMKDFEQEINDSFKTAKKVESEDNGKWDRFAELIETKEQFDVKIIEVVKGGEDVQKEAFTDCETGILVNSGFLDGLSVEDAKAKMIEFLTEMA